MLAPAPVLFTVMCLILQTCFQSGCVFPGRTIRRVMSTYWCINLVGGTVLPGFLFQKQYVSGAAC